MERHWQAQGNLGDVGRRAGGYQWFFPNHLIHELLPAKGDGLRWANSDPIKGQAVWFDLRVKIEKVDTPEVS